VGDHEFGDENVWWQKQKLDPLEEAERLWRMNHEQLDVA